MSLSAVERVYRRVMMMICRGRITTGNDAGNVQLLQAQFGADEIRDATPRLAEYGFASHPLPGADAVAIFLAGDRSNGVIIATGDQRYRLKNLAPGEVALYDDQGQVVHLTRDGIVIRTAKSLRLEAADIVQHASHSWSWDVDGYGQRVTSLGGGAYEIRTWQQGATVTTVTGPINPPEGP